MSLLQARGLTKSFLLGDRRTPVLKGIDLDLEGGQTLVILGPSGCGKTTLLNMLSLLDRPDEGTLVLEGVDYAKAQEAARRKYRETSVGFIFQAFHLIDELSVLDNAALPGKLAGTADPMGRARELLEQLGIGSLAFQRPALLSGGERQRVAVARALHHRPRWLHADEPTGNLDPDTGNEVMQLIRLTCIEAGSNLVLVTHNEGLIQSEDRVVRLDHGKIASSAVSS